MKFALILASRGRPRRAAAVLECARLMASGKHEVEYVIACDDDDPADTAGFFRFYDGVTLDCRPRGRGPGGCFQRNATRSADMFLAFPDDCFIASPNWDAEMADFVRDAYPHRALAVLSWLNTAQPNQPTLIASSREWVDMAGFHDDRFPFWFSDTAIAETWSFVTGRLIPIVPTLIAASRSQDWNPRLRDMDFWWDYYIHLRAERLATAATIRAKLGIKLPEVILERTLWDWQTRDTDGRRESLAIVETFTDPPTPTAHYLRAKALAEADMLQVAA